MNQDPDAFQNFHRYYVVAYVIITCLYTAYVTSLVVRLRRVHDRIRSLSSGKSGSRA